MLWVVEYRRTNADDWAVDSVTTSESAANEWATEQLKLYPDYEWRVRELPSAEGLDKETPLCL